MPTSLRIGRVAGIPVTVHWSALVITLLITQGLAVTTLPGAAPGYPAPAYWLAATMGSIAFTGCLLAHELAHARIAKRVGLQVKRITLWLLGGMAQLDGQAPSPRADFAIAAAGPAASLLCAGGFWLAALAAGPLGWGRLAFVALAWLAEFNALIAAFNLLPGAPLDGGRVLRALLWWRGGDRRRAEQASTRTGVGLGVALAVLGWIEILAGGLGGLWFVLLGLFLVSAARAESNAAVTAGITITAAEVMTPDPDCAPGWYTLGAFLDWTRAHGQHAVYPVRDFDGRPVGVIVLGDLARIRSLRGYTRVQDAARPLSGVPVLRPQDPVARLASTARYRTSAGLALVIEDGRLAGVIDLDNLAATVQLAMLRSRFAAR